MNCANCRRMAERGGETVAAALKAEYRSFAGILAATDRTVKRPPLQPHLEILWDELAALQEIRIHPAETTLIEINEPEMVGRIRLRGIQLQHVQVLDFSLV